jgi:predicted flap endonuclease-1-like 5' DNA nuclease
MFWHMVQFAGYLIVAALVGLAVGWLIWARSSQRAHAAFEARAKEMREELMERRSESAANAEELARLRRREAAAEASAAAAVKAAKVSAANAAATKAAEPAPEPAAQAETEPVAQPATDSAPAVQTFAAVSATPEVSGTGGPGAPENAPEPAAEPVEPDDLTKIEGIGPKMAAALHGAGLSTFAHVAAATEEALTAAIAAAGMKFAPSLPTWARQSEFLVNGDHEGFAAYTESLVAGREADS